MSNRSKASRTKLNKAQQGKQSLIPKQPLSEKLESAIALHREGKFSAAQTIYQEILKIDPNHFDATQLLGTIYAQSEFYEDAIPFFKRAHSINPGHIATLNNFANALVGVKKYTEAIGYFEKAIQISPDYAEAYNNLGNAYQASKKIDLAIPCFEKAIALKVNYYDALNNLGNAYKELKKLDLALVCYKQVIALKSDYEYLYGLISYLRMYMCDWGEFDIRMQELSRRILQKQKASSPFSILGMVDSSEIQLACASTYIREKYPINHALGPIPKRNRKDKIRIGYFSADFHSYATAFLMAEFFESHNKEKFEIFAFSFGDDQKDAMRHRLSAAFDQFIDVRGQTDKEITALSRSLEIDIAVDLKGFTADGRTKIFAYRAAPIQVNYLGYPGTMGSNYIDYIIADETLIPPESQQYYSEKIIYLPNSYQVNDRKRPISEYAFTRQELGLPENGFVFCCFNNNYKITPGTFDSWMRILHAVEGSVLWLLQDNDWVISNLRNEALKRGISPERILFAERIELDKHLARHRQADLFIDTLPYNAHTTSSDALWAGLPVLTLAGQSFAGRVSASLLNAIDLPELITNNLPAYEALAIELASKPAKLSAIKRKLENQRLTTPLFNTPLFTVHMETAYTRMMERYWLDLPPESMTIETSEAVVKDRLNALGQIQTKPLASQALANRTPFPLNALLTQGMTLYQEGKYEEARLIYEQILQNDPLHYDSIQVLGAIAAQTRQFTQAQNLLAKALSINANHVSVLNNYGLVLKELRKFDESIKTFDKAISLQTDYADAHYNRGNVMLDLRRFEDAVVSYEQAIAYKSDYIAAYTNRGNALHELGKLEEALASYDAALHLNPNSVDALCNRGNSLLALKQLDAAVASYKKALTLRPDYAEAYLNRGLAYHQMKQFDAAILDNQKAISLKPDFPQAFYNLGNALLAQEQFDAAIQSYQEALRLNPDYAEAYNNWGNALKEKNQLEKADKCYDRAIAIKPDFAEAHTNKSLALLLAGDYKTGWELFEWRWKSDIFSKSAGKREYSQALWLGNESIQDKTILLYPEQGFGDIIQFSRYVQLVSALGAKVLLEAPKPLMSLLKDLPGIAQIIEKGHDLPYFDVQCPLHSLPLALKTTIDNIPSPTQYLHSDSQKVAMWNTKLGVKNKPRIGLVWSSNSTFKADAKRSLKLADLLKALPTEGVEYICLQKVIKDEDLETLNENPQIQFFGDQLEDFSDTAALIDCVDLVLSTCTSVPHLSAALGRQTWLMISYNPDWRWLLDRTDSPWYQSITLYRQPVARDWDSVFKKVKEDLLEFIKTNKCS